MAVLEINGRRVEIDDGFLTLSPELQEQAVDEIAQEIGLQGPQQPSAVSQLPAVSGLPPAQTTQPARQAQPAAATGLIPEQPGIFESIAQAFTGEGRLTPRAQQTPELAFSDLLAEEGVAANAKIAALSLITPDVNEMARILQSNFPFIDIEQDQRGNIFAINTKTGAEAILNRPGFSYSDFIGLIGQGLLFTPAGRGLGATTRAGRVGQVAGRSALTQTAVEEAQAMAGGQFNPEDIALETALGAGGQAAGEAIGAAARFRANRLSREAARATQRAELAEAQRLGQPLAPELQQAQQTRVLERIAAAAEEAAPGTGQVELPKLRELAQEADIDPEALAAAQRLGVAQELLPSQLARNQEYIEIEQGLASIIGSQLNARQKIGIDLVAQKADDLITEFGGTIDKAALSDQLRNTLMKNISRLEEQSNEIFTRVNRIIPGRTQVEMPKTLYAYEQEAADLGGLRFLEPFEQDFYKMASENPTYARLDKERQKLGAALQRKEGPYKDLETGMLKKAYALLIGDQQAAADLHGAGRLFKVGRDLVQQRKILEKNSLTVLGRDKAGAIMPKLGEGLKRAARGDLKAFKNTMQILDPEEQQIAVLSALNDVFTGASRKEKQLSAPAFVDWYKALQRNQTAFKEVMRYVPKDAQKRLEDLFTVANRMRLAGAERVGTGRLRTLLDDFQAPGGFVDKLYGAGKDAAPTALVAEVAGQITTGVPGAGGLIGGVVKAMAKPTKDKLSVAATNLLADPEFQKMTKELARAKVESDAALQAAAEAVTRSQAYQDWLDELPTDLYKQALRLGVVLYFTSPNPEPTPYTPPPETNAAQPLELTITPADIPQVQR